MSGAAITPERDAERERWQRQAAAWNQWADAMAEMAEKLNQPLLDAAAIKPGDTVLDLATGTGEPALSAARRVGPEGLVIGSDFAQKMLAGAIRRRDSEGLRLPLIGADIAALPIADASVDAVTCRFGIMFLADTPAGLREMKRVVKPGGHIALMVWGPRSENTLFDVIYDVMAPYRDQVDAMPTTPQFRYGDIAALRADLEAGGLGAAAIQSIQPLRRVPLNPPFWETALDMSHRYALEALGAARRAEIDERLHRRFAALSEPDEEHDRVVPLHSHVRLITATVPTP